MLGLLFTYTLGAWLEPAVLSGVCALIPLLSIASLHFLPASPVFLLSRGDKDQAAQALRYSPVAGTFLVYKVWRWFLICQPRFYRGGVDSLQELGRLEGELQARQGEEKVGLARIVSTPAYLQPLAISLTLMLLQQFSGIKAASQHIISHLVFLLAVRMASGLTEMLWLNVL